MDKGGTERQTFFTGEWLRFEIRSKIIKPIPRLSVSLFLSAGYPQTPITSISRAVSASNQTGFIDLEIPRLNIRLGQYSLYFWLGASSVEPYDVTDGVSPHLIVDAPVDQNELLDCDRVDPYGYFDLSAIVRFN
jgi:hypothetical protein